MTALGPSSYRNGKFLALIALCALWLHLINIPLKEIIETTIIGAFISLLIMIDGGPATIVIIIVYYH